MARGKTIEALREELDRLPRPAKRKSIVEKLGSPRHAVARSAYTVDEFCWSNGFSRAAFYKMKARGEGPDEFRVGKRVLISEEAAARWRKKRTQAEHRPAPQIVPPALE